MPQTLIDFTHLFTKMNYNIAGDEVDRIRHKNLGMTTDANDIVLTEDGVVLKMVSTDAEAVLYGALSLADLQSQLNTALDAL